MSAVAAKLRFGWIELSSIFPTEVEKKRKRVDEEAAEQQLMPGHVIQQNHNALAPLDMDNTCRDGLSPVALSSSSSSSSSGSSFNSDSLDLSVAPTPGSDWEKCLDLKTGRFYFVNRNNDKRDRQARVEVENEGLCLDLGLHLGAHKKKRKVVEKESVCSPPHSAISFQEDPHRDYLDATRWSNNKTEECLVSSPLPTSPLAPLVIVGCSKCLMFLMLSQDNPRCPRCGTSALLDLSLNKSNQGTHFGSSI